MTSDAAVAEAALPDSFRRAFSLEFWRSVKPPFEVPLVILINGLLVLLFWFTPYKDQMFTLHGALAFPIVLGSWMISDVPATNVVAADRTRMLAALDDDDMLMRLLAAKSALLWVLVAPICVIIAMIIGISNSRPISALWTIMAIAILPLGALAVCNWIGIIWPYNPISLKVRWQERRKFRTQSRWIILVFAPYVIVPFVICVTAVPAYLWWHHETGGVVKPISDALFGDLVLLSSATSVLFYFGARWVSRRLLQRRREKLRTYLTELSG